MSAAENTAENIEGVQKKEFYDELEVYDVNLDGSSQSRLHWDDEKGKFMVRVHVYIDIVVGVKVDHYYCSSILFL
jgi:hypothetical protein